MPSVKQSERGLTLIEVTLAIVIGVVVVAGATVFYQQAARSAGNVKAQNKTSAMAAMIEEFGVRQHKYPSHAQLRSLWIKTRPDALTSPWGGPIGVNGLGAANGIATNPDAFTDPWEIDNAPQLDNAAVIGYYVAANGNETKAVTEYESGRTRTYRGYVIAMWNQDGYAPCFVSGPKFSGH